MIAVRSENKNIVINAEVYNVSLDGLSSNKNDFEIAAYTLFGDSSYFPLYKGSEEDCKRELDRYFRPGGFSPSGCFTFGGLLWEALWLSFLATGI